MYNFGSIFFVWRRDTVDAICAWVQQDRENIWAWDKDRQDRVAIYQKAVNPIHKNYNLKDIMCKGSLINFKHYHPYLQPFDILTFSITITIHLIPKWDELNAKQVIIKD